MKQGKKPTRAQKIILSQNRLKWENWAVVAEDKSSFTIKHRTSGKLRKLVFVK